MNSQKWFSSDQYNSYSTLWLQAIARLENIAIIFPPRADRPRRIDQLLHDEIKIKKIIGHPVIFQTLDLDIIDDMDDLYENTASHLNVRGIQNRHKTFEEWMSYFEKQKTILIIVLNEAEKYLTPHGKIILEYFAQLSSKYDPYLKIISVFEKNILHPSMHIYLPSTTSLYANISYYPLYNPDDTYKLIQYLSLRWGLHVTRKNFLKIYEQCGGHLWLVADALRQLSINASWDTFRDSFQTRLQLITDAMLPSEKALLNKNINQITNNQTLDKHSLSYLKHMRFLDTKNTCLVPALQKFIQPQILQQIHFFISNNKIYLNNINIDRYFSRKEKRIFQLLLQNTQQIVDRDTIALNIWPTQTQEHYSDWAIDQLITRLRKKIREITTTNNLIQSVRNKGYLFNLPKQ